MTRGEFLHLLQENHIYERISFDGELVDGCGIRKTSVGWEVFIQERGNIYESVGFPSESDALTYLYEKLINLYAVLDNQQLKDD